MSGWGEWWQEGSVLIRDITSFKGLLFLNFLSCTFNLIMYGIGICSIQLVPFRIYLCFHLMFAIMEKCLMFSNRYNTEFHFARKLKWLPNASIILSCYKSIMTVYFFACLFLECISYDEWYWISSSHDSRGWNLKPTGLWNTVVN